MMADIKQVCDDWLQNNNLAEDDGDDENDEDFKEEESLEKAGPLKKRTQVGRRKLIRDD